MDREARQSTFDQQDVAVGLFHDQKINVSGKPKYLKVAEDCDFFQLFTVVEQRYENCFLLESLGEESYISRHFIIGFDPSLLIRSPDPGTLVVEDTVSGEVAELKSDNPYYLLRDIMPENIVSRRYAGGLVGYLGYDAINFFEPHLKVKNNDDFEPFMFGLYLDGLIYDQVTGEIFYYYYNENRFDLVCSLLNEPPPERDSLSVAFLGHSMSKEDHSIAVGKVKEEICSGRVLQCEVGFRSQYRVDGDTLQIYEKLRSVNPSPHMYYLKFGDRKIIGASPELLFRLKEGVMETYPLAGTAGRGVDDKEDLRLARMLLNDPKEIAEHNMLVDLHRNDLGRVAQFGSVKVRSLMDVKRYSHVQHISSEIVGALAEGEDMFSALASNFPAGTLTGAPKLEAIKLIDELEDKGRGPYGGALGQFSLNGDCAFAIPIRSIFIRDQDAYVQTCGGNVFDSNAEDEFNEILRKLTAMKKVLAEFEGEAI